MDSRVLHRETGQVAQPNSRMRRLRRLAWPLAACAGLICLLAWGHAVDTEQQHQYAFFAGIAVGRMEMAETVDDAYSMGLRDALRQRRDCGIATPSLDRRAQRAALREQVCAGAAP